MNATDLLKLGYADLISVTPPGAKLSPQSKLRPEDCGKVPGRKNGQGLYGGYDWQNAPRPEAKEVAKWQRDGANIGLRAAYFPAVDIDCTEPALAELIEQLAFLHLGVAPKRVGRSPKALLIYRTREPFRRMRLWINEKHLIEVLGDGQQYVVAGTHPVTGKPYEWPWGLLAADDLIEITHDDAESFLAACQEALEALGYACRREGHGGLAVDREAINQEALSGEYEKIAAALALIPNDNEHFPGRTDYIRMGCAIKAALGEEGWPLFEEWAAKWEGNDQFDGNDPETVRADWERMKPPFEVGAPWIFETASEFGYEWAAEEFEALEDAPPPDDSSADTTNNSVTEAEGDDKPTGGVMPYTHMHVGLQLVKRYGERIRYCEDMEKWLAFDGKRWSRTGQSEVQRYAETICRQQVKRAMLELAATPTKAEQCAMRMCSVDMRDGAVRYARAHKAVAIAAKELDAHQWLLNTPVGELDTTTGAIAPHDAAHYHTRMTSVAPVEGDAPVWDRFVSDLTDGNKELEAFLYRYLGSGLTASKRDHKIVFMYGPGGNGKSTFMDAIREIMADYAAKADMALFLEQKFDTHPTGLSDLENTRLVLAEETRAGRNWNEELMKVLSSGGSIKARRMREDFREFPVTFKLLLAGNSRPSLRNLDDALRRRFLIVPLKHKPDVPDPLLPEKLRAEYPQILARIVRGCLDWYANGLNPPKIVLEETGEYFATEDTLGQWAADRIAETGSRDDFVASADLFDDWREWCGINGEHPGSARSLGRRLAERGWNTAQRGVSRTRGFVGVRLTKQPGDEFQSV